jgi:hypothetical protein
VPGPARGDELIRDGLHLASFRSVVEGHYLMQRPADGEPQPVTMGSAGIAISHDGQRLYYCPLASRRLYSVSVDALCGRALDDAAVADTVIDEGDKGTGSDGLETDDAGNLYLTAYEHDAVLRRRPGGGYEALVHDPRLLWPDTGRGVTDRSPYARSGRGVVAGCPGWADCSCWWRVCGRHGTSEQQAWPSSRRGDEARGTRPRAGHSRRPRRRVADA